MRRFALLLLLAAPAVLAQGFEGISPLAAGTAALEAGDHAEAVRLFREALAEDPENAEIHYALARVYALEGPAHDERATARHLDRALRLHPDDARFLEARLAAFRRTLSEERAFSTTDTRRPALARRLLDLDPENVLAHEELALSALLEFDWRRHLARRQGGWDPAATRGMSGGANEARARAETHLAAALTAAPERESLHRLRLRLAALADDTEALTEAAHAFAEALPDAPAAALYVGLAAYRANDLAAAEAAFAAALAGFPPEERAAYERLTPFVVDREDEAAFAADSAAFAARFWQARDPRLLSSQNERRLEHVARLALADLLFADPLDGTRGWETPRGQLVVRYGLPDTYGRWLGADFVGKSFGALERWVYADDESGDGFSLLFEDPFYSGDFDFWSSAAGEDDATRARSLFRRTPERFRYAPPGGLTPFPQRLATFKGEGGRTDLVVAYGVPLAASSPAPTADGFVGLRSGAFLLDAEAQVVAETRRTVERLRPGWAVRQEAATLLADGLAVSAAPGAYTLAVEFDQTHTGAVGVARTPVELPDYAAPGLHLSDVLLALAIEEGEGVPPRGALARGRYAILPAPGDQFVLGDPIYLYAEAYGLALRGGRSDYELEAVLVPEARAGVLGWAARLLGRRSAPGVSVRLPLSGTAADEGQYVILDTTGQAPGAYVLTLRVRDRHTAAVAEATRRLVLEAGQ